MEEGGGARWSKYLRGRGGKVEQVFKGEGWQGGASI